MSQRPGQPRIISIIWSKVFLGKVATTRPATHHQHHLLQGFPEKGCKAQTSHASSASFVPKCCLERLASRLICSIRGFSWKCSNDQASRASSASFAPRFFLERLQQPGQPHIISIICSKVSLGKVAKPRPATHHQHHLFQSVVWKGWPAASFAPFTLRFFLEMFQRPGQPRIISIICFKVFLGKVATTRPATHHQHHLLQGFPGKGCKAQASHASSASFVPKCCLERLERPGQPPHLLHLLRGFSWKCSNDQASRASSASFGPRFFLGKVATTRPATHHQHHLL